ncbi:hypothetical protein SLEP1_g53047 [Rubroshorea leprosula]|uniref:Uncharacterized protein n=1 Tax=Rubroshorea leprosula TaxID=152421 RepID=A0AAV5M873_9ROSI|nr:hypothetical protein SLEP1_g53047 [Rubroshorea leprosula]
MTKEEGKGQKGKERAGNEAGNRPSAEEEESSKQLAEEENKENMHTGTGTANEADNKQSFDEKMVREEKKIKSFGDFFAELVELELNRLMEQIKGAEEMLKV